MLATKIDDLPAFKAVSWFCPAVKVEISDSFRSNKSRVWDILTIGGTQSAALEFGRCWIQLSKRNKITFLWMCHLSCVTYLITTHPKTQSAPNRRIFTCIEVCCFSMDLGTSIVKCPPIRAQYLCGSEPMRVVHSGREWSVLISRLCFSLSYLISDDLLDCRAGWSRLVPAR